MKNYKNKKCVICGKDFKPGNARQKRCFDCLVSKCEKCGKELKVGPGRIIMKKRLCWECHCSPAGTFRKEKNGYVSIKTSEGWKHYHRYIAEEILGRELQKGEVVHHKDGDRSNNSEDNLVVCKNTGSHLREHHGTGVSYDKKNKKWTARYMENKKYIYIGQFKSKSLALGAVNAARKAAADQGE